jgi:hypothetical protein
MQASLQANLCPRLFPIRVHEGCARRCDPGGGLGRNRITPRTSGTPGAEPSIALMKNLTRTAVFAALILFQVSPAWAASIGVSFLGDGAGGTALAPADSAGVVAQTNWNNISSIPTGNVGISGPLLDSAANFTTVLLQFAANDAWNADGPTDTANDRLMKGIIKQDGVGSSMTLMFTNLAAGAYDLYVYGNVNGGPVDLDVSIGATTNYWTEPAAFDDGTGFIQAASSDPNLRAAGNYAKFTGVTPVSGAITLTATHQGGSDGLGIAGLQLVTAGSFPPNTIPVAIAAPPQPQLVAPGGAALFSVSATGPVAGYQWFTNGVAIAGATSSSYTTPALSLSDSGTRYKVTIHNNVNSVTSDEVVLTVMNDPGTRVASIGVSFLGSNGGDVSAWALAPTDSAGVVAQAHWNNVTCNGPPYNGGGPNYTTNTGALLDSAGDLIPVDLQFDANDAWNADGPVDTPNDKLMKGVLKQDSGNMTLTFTNLTLVPAFLDVYVYGDVDTGPEDLDVSIGATTYYWTQPGAFDDTTGFILSASTDPNTRAEGNYVKFAGVGVTPASSVTITATVVGGPTGLGIAGVQVFSSAAFPTNKLAPEVTQQPVSTYAVVGGTASFTVGLNGRWAVQWRKNGAPIPGATDLSYTTPPLALADSGSSFDASITNNIGSTNSVAATVTVDPASPPVFTQGFLTVQRYTNITGTALVNLYSDTSYPASPAINYWVAGADVPQTVPDLSDFGAIAWGWLAPTITADYTFFIRSDDASAFYINTNAGPVGVTNAVPIPNSGASGSDVPVCEESGCCNDFLEPDPNSPGWDPGVLGADGQTTLTPIHLEAGKLYGICLAYKEEGGNDYVQLAWRPAGDTNAAASLRPIPMPFVWTLASHAGNRVSITQQPQSATVLLNTTATLSVDASTFPTPGQWAAQWMKNGIDIPGANGASYTTPTLQLSDSGTHYGARIIALAGATNSETATITVVSSLGTTLTISASANSVTIGWTGTTGTLESTPALLGTNTVWSTVGTQDPATIPIVPGENRFYRVKQ